MLFDTTLIESCGIWLSGRENSPASEITRVRSEPCNKGKLIYATLLGEHNGSRVTFTKTYDGTAPGYTVVEYAGVLSADASERFEGALVDPGRTWSKVHHV